MSNARRAVTLAAVLTGGCAQIQTTSKVEIVAKDDAPARVFGPPAAAVTARGATIAWTQQRDAIAFEIYATKRCAVLRHDPVVRVERITRSSGGAVYWEFGVGGVLLAAGLTALIRPELFGQTALNAEGQQVRDTTAGYRLGGILTALSAVPLGAGVYDLARSRDEVRTTDAYRVHVGEAAACDEPELAAAGRTVEFIVGDWKTTATTDAQGRVQVQLPGVDEPPTTTVALDDPGQPPEAETLTGVLRLGGREALTVDFVVPYESAEAQGHSGRVVIEPQPLRRAPPKPGKRPDLGTPPSPTDSEQ